MIFGRLEFKNEDFQDLARLEKVHPISPCARMSFRCPRIWVSDIEPTGQTQPVELFYLVWWATAEFRGLRPTLDVAVSSRGVSKGCAYPVVAWSALPPLGPIATSLPLSPLPLGPQIPTITVTWTQHLCSYWLDRSSLGGASRSKSRLGPGAHLTPLL